MMGVAEVLNAAADLLEKPGAWTQGTWARGADGLPDPTRETAVCFCLYGAIKMAAGFAYCEPAIDAVIGVVGRDFIGWNDAPGRAQAEVVAALRKAATKPLKAQQNGEGAA